MKQKSIEEVVDEFLKRNQLVFAYHDRKLREEGYNPADHAEAAGMILTDILTKRDLHLIQTIRKEVEGVKGKWKAIYYPESDERRLPLEEKLFETEKEAWEAVENHTKRCSIAGREGWVKGEPCESCLAEWGVHENEEISFEDILTYLTTLEEEITN